MYADWISYIVIHSLITGQWNASSLGHMGRKHPSIRIIVYQSIVTCRGNIEFSMAHSKVSENLKYLPVSKGKSNTQPTGFMTYGITLSSFEA